MSLERKFIKLTPGLYEYLAEHGHNRDPVLAELALETAKLGGVSVMQITPEQGTLLTILVKAVKARRALEIGTFTGYSSICIARGLPAGGTLLCCDINERWTSIAQKYWSRAEVAGKITLRLDPALTTLCALPKEETFDFVFIDADKPNYRSYYEEALIRVHSGSPILIDNVLWSGKIIDAGDVTADTLALRELNDFIATDNRVQAVMLPVADGLTIALKK